MWPICLVRGSRKTGHIVLFFWLAEADSRLYAEFELFQLVRECIHLIADTRPVMLAPWFDTLMP